MEFKEHHNNEVNFILYEYAILQNDQIIIDSLGIFDVVFGKHCLWIPEIEMKIIWSHKGKIESFKDWDKGRNYNDLLNDAFGQQEYWDTNSIYSILTEYCIFKHLAIHNISPPVGKMVYIKQFISKYPIGKYCDIRGRFGYYIKNANKLPTRIFDNCLVEQILFNLRQLKNVSAGFKGDILKSNNSINGYLIDIRRTLWDMPIFNFSLINLTKAIEVMEDIVKEDKFKLIYDIEKLTQFPHKERKQNYQSYYIDGSYLEGSRNTVERFDKMGIAKDLTGEAILDLGCNLGSMCVESYLRGGRNVVGLDYESDYIDCARRLAKYNDMPINFLHMDLTSKDIKIFLKDYYDKLGVRPIVFALSLYKHVTYHIWEVLNSFEWRKCYFESNNAPNGFDSPHAIEIENGIKTLKNVKFDRIGMTNDRSPRCLWLLQKV